MVRSGAVKNPEEHLQASRQMFAAIRAMGADMFEQMKNWKEPEQKGTESNGQDTPA
jgi:hypothetical protein